MKGIEKNIPQHRVNLKGAKKGDATSVAIMLLPSGNFAIRGLATKLYISLEKGIKINVITKMHVILHKTAFRNSSR
tara:strand:+ start:118 stop:345 length:228 start_codon:yes stop_codon:yes gene_type:complete